MCPLIEDDVLKLIPFTKDDLLLTYKCFQDKQTQLGFNYIISSSYEEYARSITIEYYPFWAVIVHKKTNKKIGSIRLSPFESNPDLCIFLLRRYRNRGFGTRAFSLGIQYCFNHLGMKEIVAGCYEHNHISRRMLEKLHFKRYPAHDIVERSVFTGERIVQHAYHLPKNTFSTLHHIKKKTPNYTISR